MEPALRRTIRRCTAILVLVLGVLLYTLVLSFESRGVPTVSRLVPIAVTGTATLYLLGSAVDVVVATRE